MLINQPAHPLEIFLGEYEFSVAAAAELKVSVHQTF
jgi:hypothetical protein